MLNQILLLGCLLGQTVPLDVTKSEPIYGQRGGHPWDALHQAFFVRTFTTGETYHHRLSFDVPWARFARLSQQRAEYDDLLRRFDALDRLPQGEMENATPTRRLIFFRDLWTVFDKLESMESKTRGEELRRRIARVMRRLELTDDEIVKLPDTLASVRAAAAFPESPDPERPAKPFVPAALLDDASEWIAIATNRNGTASAPHHSASVNGRSLFSLHMLWPEGRKAGEAFLLANRLRDNIRFPPGTELALLRRAVAADGERLKVTRVVESLQLIVTPPADAREDVRFKFVLDRTTLLSGRPGLVPLNDDSPVDAWGFESTGQWTFDPKDDADGERLVLGKGKGHVGIPSMKHCGACHGLRNTRYHANFGAFPVHATTNAALAGGLEKDKRNSETWRAYLKLRALP